MRRPSSAGLIGGVHDLGGLVSQSKIRGGRLIVGNGLHEVLELTHVAANDLIGDKSLVPAQLGGQHLGDVHIIQALFIQEIGVQDVSGG